MPPPPERTTTVREQNLALRVMRLSRPRCNEVIPFPRDSSDAYSSAIANSLLNTGFLNSLDAPFGQFLVAPHTMSDVYVGESFTFYISIINTSANTTCKEITIKADVQTQTQRVSISEVNFNDVSLAPNQQIGQVFSHEIQEIGQHILVCAVTYSSGSGEEKMNLRKFFKFPVSKPIELIKQNFYDIENSDTFFEAQIQNLCSTPIFIETITLATNTDTGSPTYSCSEIVSPMQNDVSEAFLESRAIKQYLFRLKPIDEQISSNWRSILNFGKLNICWRTTMGDKGKISLDTAQRMTPGYGNLRLVMDQVPKRVKVNELFTAQFRLQNCSDRPLDLRLTFEQSRQPGIVHCSVSGQHLPPLLPTQYAELSLDLVPYVNGLQQISGIRITDLQLKRIYEFDDVCQIFVY